MGDFFDGWRRKSATWISSASDVKSIIIISVVVSVLVLMMFQLLDSLVNQEPYRMSMMCIDGQTAIQFSQDGRSLISPQFATSLPCNVSQEIVLKSGQTSIPGCIIEFCDNTVLPGRFTIRIGSQLYDVMERGIEVGEKTYHWQHR